VCRGAAFVQKIPDLPNLPLKKSGKARKLRWKRSGKGAEKEAAKEDRKA
jgi:hypothetical protein